MLLVLLGSCPWLDVNTRGEGGVLSVAFRRLLVVTTQSTFLLLPKMQSFVRSLERYQLCLSSMHLENLCSLSHHQQGIVDLQRQQKINSHMYLNENYKFCTRDKKNKIDSQGATNSSDIEERSKQSYRDLKTKRNILGVVDKVRFKRKRAKGLNPLSCKKKKNKESISLADKVVPSYNELSPQQMHEENREDAIILACG